MDFRKLANKPRMPKVLHAVPVELADQTVDVQICELTYGQRAEFVDDSIKAGDATPDGKPTGPTAILRMAARALRSVMRVDGALCFPNPSPSDIRTILDLSNFEELVSLVMEQIDNEESQEERKND